MQRHLKTGGGKSTDLYHEIGSTYWLCEHEIQAAITNEGTPLPVIKGVKGTYLSTCRSGIQLVLQQLTVQRKTALVPAFTCESVLMPFLKEGYDVFPYPVQRNLSVDEKDFLKCVEEKHPSVVLIHRYFGFDTLPNAESLIQRMRKSGITVIEDLTQTMFSEYPLGQSNYLVGSMRKWFPIPDGAFVSSIYRDLPEDTELSEAKLNALRLKGKFIEKGEGKRSDFREAFAMAERILDARNVPYSISSISKRIISHTNLAKMKDTRWKNYFYLSAHLQAYEGLEVFLTLNSSQITPFMLPVYVKANRKGFQKYLAENEIYATIIWGCPSAFEKNINEDARYIYNHILCFHCDQRYGISDMERIVTVINSYYNEQQ